MPLSLTLANVRQWPPGMPTSRVLTSGRLSIGRSASNDWMLPDPERIVSKHHCVIEGADETFRLFDSSVNGVFINEADQPVGTNKAYLLRNGDRIRIGCYEIEVAIKAHADDAHADRPGIPQETAFNAPLASAADLFGHGPDPLGVSEDESLFATPDGGVKRHHLADLDGGTPTDEAFSPPRMSAEPPPGSRTPAPSTIPDTSWNLPVDLPAPETAMGSDKAGLKSIPTEWDPFAPGSSQSEPARAEPVHPVPPPRDEAPATAPDSPSVATPLPPPGAFARAQSGPDIVGEDRLVKAFLAGAGVDRAAVPIGDAERMMREAGAIFRIVVAGMISVLESRRALKREVGVAATEFRPAENNPLKFTLGVDDTVRILLTGGERGYLPPTQAFEEAFADIKQHQIAVLAGMQEAWMDLLRRLDPKALERRLGEDGGRGGLLISKKARCWDAFTQLYETIANDAEADYKSLFSRVFSYAYEKHLSEASEKRR